MNVECDLSRCRHFCRSFHAGFSASPSPSPSSTPSLMSGTSSRFSDSSFKYRTFPRPRPLGNPLLEGVHGEARLSEGSSSTGVDMCTVQYTLKRRVIDVNPLTWSGHKTINKPLNNWLHFKRSKTLATSLQSECQAVEIQISVRAN